MYKGSMLSLSFYFSVEYTEGNLKNSIQIFAYICNLP